MCEDEQPAHDDAGHSGADGTRHGDVVCFPTLEWGRHVRDTGAVAREVADDEEDQHGTPGRLRVQAETEVDVAELPLERIVAAILATGVLGDGDDGSMTSATPHCGRSDINLQLCAMSEKTNMATIRSKSNLTMPTKLVTAMFGTPGQLRVKANTKW